MLKINFWAAVGLVNLLSKIFMRHLVLDVIDEKHGKSSENKNGNFIDIFKAAETFKINFRIAIVLVLLLIFFFF